MRDIQYRKVLPVLGAYDVIVAGAGPAGICAAVAAARMGAKTVLVERYGTVGGNLTVGYVGPILGMVGKGTMRDEIVSLLGVPNNDMIGEVGVAHDIEKAKIALTEFVSHENLTVYLQTPVADVIKEGDAVTGIAVLTKDGLKVIEGKPSLIVPEMAMWLSLQAQSIKKAGKTALCSRLHWSLRSIMWMKAGPLSASAT